MGELEFRAAEPADHERLLAAAAARGGAASERLVAHLLRPRYRPALTRLAEQGGAVVGALLLGHQRLRLGAATLDAGAIEDYWLDLPGDEPLMGLLGDCLGALVAEQLPMLLLHGAPAGLAGLGCAPYSFDSSIGLVALASGDAPALRSAAEADLDDLAALYASSYAQLALAQARATPDWRVLLAGGSLLTQPDARGRLVGYALAERARVGEALMVSEAASADAGAARDLLAGLRSWAAAQGCARAELLLPAEHQLAQAALHAGGALALRAWGEDEAAPLAGVVDLLGTLGALAPELERRLAQSRYAAWEGNLRIETADERISLVFAGGRAEVIDGTRPADLRLRRVELPALAQLLLGYRAAADLRATGGLACDDTVLGLVDALFPALTPVAAGAFWG